MPNNELKAPAGKFRVIGIDLFESANEDADYLIGDFDTQAEAFKIADDRNRKRTGSMDDVYYVYDDQGRYVRGNEVVGQRVSP